MTFIMKDKQELGGTMELRFYHSQKHKSFIYSMKHRTTYTSKVVFVVLKVGKYNTQEYIFSIVALCPDWYFVI